MPESKEEKSSEEDEGYILAFVRMIDVLIAADRRTQGEIAEAAGIKPKHLSDKLIGKHKKLTESDVRAIARALRVDAGVLLNPVSKKKLLELASEREKSSQAARSDAQLSESPSPASHDATAARPTRADRVASLDRHLFRRLIRSVEKSDENTEMLHVYKVAASRPDEDVPMEPRPVWVPRSIRKLFKKHVMALRIVGESMLDAGIEPGDIVFAKFVSRPPADRAIVIARLHGATTCKRLVGNELRAESPVHEDPVPVEDDSIVGEVLAIYKP